MRNLPKCLRGRVLSLTCLDTKYTVMLSEQERVFNAVTQYSWPVVDVENNPHWFQEIPEDEDITISRIWEHQSNPMFHPLTCGTDSNHALLSPITNADGEIVLVCDDCAYHQVFNINPFTPKEDDK